MYAKLLQDCMNSEECQVELVRRILKLEQQQVVKG
jgi:hypothetical protein